MGRVSSGRCDGSRCADRLWRGLLRSRAPCLAKLSSMWSRGKPTPGSRCRILARAGQARPRFLMSVFARSFALDAGNCAFQGLCEGGADRHIAGGYGFIKVNERGLTEFMVDAQNGGLWPAERTVLSGAQGRQGGDRPPNGQVQPRPKPCFKSTRKGQRKVAPGSPVAKVITGFAGATADAFTLFRSRLGSQARNSIPAIWTRARGGNSRRKTWPMDPVNLRAGWRQMIAVADAQTSLILFGARRRGLRSRGRPGSGIGSGGSGGKFAALAAARAAGWRRSISARKRNESRPGRRDEDRRRIFASTPNEGSESDHRKWLEGDMNVFVGAFSS